VLDATRALLEEVGYAGLTVVAVAARAQTSAPAVYRRFSSKAELVYQAAFPSAEAEDTGVDPDVWRASLEDGVHGLVTAISEFLHRPAVGDVGTPGPVR
jgi:AcrR family transcriptional regulator